MATIVSNGHGFPSFHSIDALLGPQNTKLGVSEQHELRVPDLSLHTRDPGGYAGSCYRAFGHGYLFGPRGKSTDSTDVEDSEEMEYSDGQNGNGGQSARRELNGMFVHDYVCNKILLKFLRK